jgi:CheY-like chemotaxis protein
MSAKLEKITFDTIRKSAAPFASRAPMPAPYSIVLIEDENSMGQVTQLLLESCGYEVTIATDGAQGLRLVRAIMPNMVICDVNMPGINGLQVVQSMRQIPTAKNTPVIFLSGYISEEQKTAARKLGVAAFLGKPCGLEEMKQVIAECRDGAAPQSAVSAPSLALALSA